MVLTDSTSDGRIKTENNEEPHIGSADTMPEEVAVMIQDEDAPATVTAVMSSNGNVHVARFAFAELTSIFVHVRIVLHCFL